MSANSTYIPRRLDDQWKICLWDMDVAVPWLVAFGIFYTALGGITGMIVGGAAGTFVYRMTSGSGVCDELKRLL